MSTPRLPALAGLLSLLFVVACGGGGGPTEADPNKEPVRAYAEQLCGPFGSFFEDAGDKFLALDDQQSVELDAALGILDELAEPLGAFRDDLKKIEPPEDLQAYHDDLVAQFDYAADAIEALSKGGLLGALALSEPPPTPEEPVGLQAALGEECGEELAASFAEFGSDFVDGGAADATATPPEPGAVGQAVASGNFELLVHEVIDPFVSSDEFYAPEAGNRWVVVELSLTNIAEETQSYNTFDFRVKDAENFEYDIGFPDLTQPLDGGSLLPEETVRGQVGFEAPEGAVLTRLTFEPGFFGEGRIDVQLP